MSSYPPIVIIFIRRFFSHLKRFFVLKFNAFADEIQTSTSIRGFIELFLLLFFYEQNGELLNFYGGKNFCAVRLKSNSVH